MESAHPHGFTLPRRVRMDGRESSLQQALRRGADPLQLEVEDGRGGWQAYIVPRASAPRRAPAVLARSLTADESTDAPVLFRRR